MAGELRRDTLFNALTRPQMFAGVTYSYFVINVILTVELFLVFKSFWVLLVGLALHLVGVLGQLNRHSRRTSAFHPKQTFESC
jgi:type IV secretion system protein VirB3